MGTDAEFRLQLDRVIEQPHHLELPIVEPQQSAETDTGRLRPDMIVRLPGGKNVVVDAKAPLEAYLDSTNNDLRYAILLPPGS